MHVECLQGHSSGMLHRDQRNQTVSLAHRVIVAASSTGYVTVPRFRAMRQIPHHAVFGAST
jgi:hypothetical protein